MRTVSDAARSVLVESAKQRRRELRTAANKARNAYQNGALSDVTKRLADAHDAAAKIYDDLLTEVAKLGWLEPAEGPPHDR